LDHSKYLVVERHTVQLPDGQVIEDWPWVITPDYACVVAVTPENRYVCFRQVKYAVEGTTLAPAGGYLEPGEEPLSAAQRELLEETGYAASEWIDLGHYAVDANRGAGTAHLYLALNARRVAEPDADDLEDQELLLLSRAEIEAALDGGAFQAVGWTAGVALALRQVPAAPGASKADGRADPA
jgi:ADP-ribose pyrophosphatase